MLVSRQRNLWFIEHLEYFGLFSYSVNQLQDKKKNNHLKQYKTVILHKTQLSLNYAFITPHD